MRYKERPLAQCEWRECRAEICGAFKKFDSRKVKAKDSGKKFFIWYDRNSYPPKEIRSILEGRATNKFSGGGKTNDLFRHLGFTVAKVKSRSEFDALAARNENTRHLRELDGRLRELFGKRWKILGKEQLEKEPIHPGVYLLAYTNRNLAGKRVDIRDVFYVGMSTTSLRARLTQFWDGIKDGGHHSAEARFYKIWSEGPFNSKTAQNRFYVADLPVECEAVKGLRSPATSRFSES